MPGNLTRRGVWVLIALALLLAAVFLPPLVNANRYRAQVVSAIGKAIGRRVSVSNIELQLLPRPAIVLSTFVVNDDPSYGPEPMLRAENVTAYIRLRSLWRRQLEVGTLSLENPSLNLVRRADGHWNIEDLLERSSVSPPATSAASATQPKIRFPYVEANAGHINFKLGQVKKAFAFADADFALWLESENEWGVRLVAHPVRSDVPVNDTGTVRLEGRFQRATSMRDTPLTLKADFSKGQFGQLTTLIYGRDRGWRGGVSATATMAGTPASLALTFDGSVDDFRRYDIALGESLRLAVHCTGTYSSTDESIRQIQCQSPVSPGLMTVRGDISGWPAPVYNFDIFAEQIPVSRVVALARHTKKDLPEDLTASGNADALFSARNDGSGKTVWRGGCKAANVVLHSKVLKPDLDIGQLTFNISEPISNASSAKRMRMAATSKANGGILAPRLVLTPFALSLGAPSPATVKGYFEHQGYSMAVAGNAELTRLLDVATAMGIGAPPVGLAGPAQIDIQIAGAWTGFAPPAPMGKIQIHNATAELRGVLEPLQVNAATVTIADQTATIGPFSSQLKDGLSITGSASFPLRCPPSPGCMLHFDLHTPEVSLARLNQLLNPAFNTRPWYHLLDISARDDNALLRLQAQGHISVDHFSIGTFVVSNLVATVAMNTGTLNLKDVRAEILGGRHAGNWDADFTAQPPKFFGSGTVTSLTMAQVGALMHDPWATGTVDGQYTLGLRGADATALRDSVNGSASFKWSGGTLRHVTLEGRGTPLSFASFDGQVLVKDGSLACQNCRIKSGNDVYDVKGHASFGRELDFRLDGPNDASYAISGPLEKPHVEATPSNPPEAKLR